MDAKKQSIVYVNNMAKTTKRLGVAHHAIAFPVVDRVNVNNIMDRGYTGILWVNLDNLKCFVEYDANIFLIPSRLSDSPDIMSKCDTSIEDMFNNRNWEID